MISILMATYNGEKYIREQLDSLLAQTVQDYLLYICDDCSEDATYSIINEYAARYPNKVFIERNETNSGSAKHTFFHLMASHQNDYVMLCDQDDVWLETKIEDTLQAMKNAEVQYGKTTPLLVHTDLQVVDENLTLIDPSFRHMMNSDFHRTRLNNQIMQNTLTGCTAMYNRALSELIYPKPAFCVMHDWWLMLIASAFGKIVPIEQPTILYRQHKDNVVGAKNMRSARYMLFRFLNNTQVRTAMSETYLQASMFLNTYKEQLSTEQRAFLEEYAAIPTKGKIGRWIAFIRLKTWKIGFFRKIAQLIFA